MSFHSAPAPLTATTGPLELFLISLRRDSRHRPDARQFSTAALVQPVAHGLAGRSGVAS